MYLRYLLLLALITSFYAAYSQQDVEFHLNSTFLQGQNILKVKRDFHDPYLWVLAQNNKVYRINSLTNVVDDYSSQFSAYSNFQFIDIAGRSQDTVFVATNSANVIELKTGVIKLISAANGLKGNVNSLGYEHSSPSRYFNVAYSGNVLVIATNNGYSHYDCDKEVMLNLHESNVYSHVFESTYRTEVLNYLTDPGYNFPNVKEYPIETSTSYSITEYVAYIYYGDSAYGNNISSIFITGTPFGGAGFDEVDLTNQLWATENGLFQNGRNFSYNPVFGSVHYLNNIAINKITSIFGLVNFGSSLNSGLTKENILVGTQQGLYFSNSGYSDFDNLSYKSYTFFHYDELGNKVINDICVNAATYTPPVCEDGVWVAAADGLYLLKPDYAPFIDTTRQLQDIQFSGKPDTLSQFQLCANTSATAVINTNNYTGNLFQWYKDGQELPNQSNTTLTITQPGDYNAVLYDPCSAIHFSTNHLKVTVIAAPVFSFNYADTLKYCNGSTATLKTDYNSIYHYRWYKDGVLNGDTTATLNTTVNGNYHVELSACSGNWLPSKNVQVNFISLPPPNITADKPAYCAGDKAVLSASIAIDSTNIVNWHPYQYRWYTNGVLNGATTPTLTVTQPGKYYVEAMACSGVWVASRAITVNFITITPPVITADKPAYCIGDMATLAVNFVNDGTYTINWFLNGNALAASQNKTTLTTNEPGIYALNVSSNLTSCSQLSAAYTLNFNQPPSVSIQQIVNTTLCDGQTVNLKAVYTGGNVKWSTGETGDIIDIKQSGIYTATVTTTSGCIATQTTSVHFFANPILTVPDATLCQYTNQTITLTAPTGFAQYEWNGEPGNNTFSTGNLGAISLTVTDNNGCKATQTINITSHCNEIFFPNTFTPNGDGINDTWTIAGISDDPTALVSVYNRYGQLVYQSKGYAVPWNGTYKGQKLPSGVYYYLISARQGKDVLSGALTIIY